MVLFGLSFSMYSGFSQRVDLISISELNQRMENGGDTTYIVNFWATWCGPCMKELPNFDQLTEQT